MGFPDGSAVKNWPAVRRLRRHGLGRSIPTAWVGKIPWRRAWQPTPVFLPGKSHGQRKLVFPMDRGNSPWGCKESDTTEHAHMHARVLFGEFNSSCLS